MTRQNAYIRHYQMWSELVEHPKWAKWDTSHYGYLCDHDIECSCYLCEVNLSTPSGASYEVYCLECPVKKISGKACGSGSWFGEWCNSTAPKTRRKYATLIRDCVIPYLTAKSKQKLGIEP